MIQFQVKLLHTGHVCLQNLSRHLDMLTPDDHTDKVAQLFVAGALNIFLHHTGSYTYRYHRSLAGGILYCTRARVQYKISPRGRQPEAEIFSYSTEGPTGPSAIR